MIPPIKKSLLVGLFVTLGTATALYIRDRRHGAEAARLRALNHSLRATLDSQPKSRTYSTTESPQEASASAQQPIQPTDTAFVSGPYRNEGQSTPGHTLQTIAWAIDMADAEKLKTLVTFDHEGVRAKVATLLSSLPPDSRAQWQTPEDMAAGFLISDGINRPYPDASILRLSEIEPLSSDRARLRLPGCRLDKSIYQRSEDGWRFVIMERDVDAYIANLKAKKTT